MSIIPQYRLSVRGDFHNKDMRGGNPASGWHIVDMSMSELAQHAASGKAMAISVFADGYRKAQNVLETNILGLDFEKGGLTAEDLAADAFLASLAGVILPTASDKPDDPRARVFIPLSRSVSSAEYKALYGAFKARYVGKVDTATSDTARFFYGALQSDFSRVFVNDYAVLNVDDFLAKHQLTVVTEPRPARHIAKSYEKEAKASWQNQKRSKSQQDLGIVYALAILDHLVRNNQQFDYDTWLKFRLAYQVFTGASDEAFEAMINHPYWRAEWDENTEYQKWQNDEPNKWNGGEGIEGWYLVWLARSLGVFTYNPVDLELPDLTITDMSQLPQGSYLLSADTGTGKTEAQIAAIKRVRSSGGRVVLVVNTRQLAYAAQGRFKQFKPVHYMNADGKLKSSDELKSAKFLIVVAQSFARWVMTHRSDAKNTSLVIFDEVQQQTASAHKQHGVGDVWSDKQQREFDNAIRLLLEAGTEIHGLDAGVNEQTRARFPDIPVVRLEKRIPRPPVTIYNRATPVLDMLEKPRNGLTVVATDTQSGVNGSKYLAELVNQRVPEAKVLRLDSETIDPKSKGYDVNAVAFMREPDENAAKYTHIIYSPTALSGLSVQFPAAVLLQFATYLTPKDNVQMKARFRNVKSVHAYYANSRQRNAAVTPDQAYERAKVLLAGQWIERNEVAMNQEQIRYLGELDELYQSLAPRDMYVHLLEGEGCTVTLNWQESERRKLEKPEEADYTDYEDEHWHEQPDEPEDIAAMTNEDYAAWKQRRHILNTVGEAATIPAIVPDTIRLSQAARGVKPSQVKNLALIAGIEGDAGYTLNNALRENVPPTHIRAYAQRLALLVSLSVLGYSGESVIPAECWRDNGQAAFDFLYKQRELWDASVPADKRWERLTERTDPITALRSMVKYMLSEWLGLEVTQGKKTRVLNPTTDARLYDMDIAGWDDLLDLLYVYEHSQRRLTKREQSIVRLTKVVFTEKAAQVELEAQANFLEWFSGKSKEDRDRALELFKEEGKRNQQPPYKRVIDRVEFGDFPAYVSMNDIPL